MRIGESKIVLVHDKSLPIVSTTSISLTHGSGIRWWELTESYAAKDDQEPAEKYKERSSRSCQPVRKGLYFFETPNDQRRASSKCSHIGSIAGVLPSAGESVYA